MIEVVYSTLVAGSAGLTSAEAQARLDRDGPNEVPAPRLRSPARLLADQLLHFFAIMLWVASGLAVLAGLTALAIAIVIVVVVNALFAFVQERRADHAAAALRSLLPRSVVVRRDGQRVEVPACGVVVGDVLLLSPGDRIPADALTTAARGVLVDASMLTGESAACAVGVGDELFAGTFAVEGEAEAVATATGPRTRLAEISRMTTTTTSATPLTVELHRVVRVVAAIAVGVGAFFFAIAALVGLPATDGFIFAIGVTVALVPEALLPTVTLSLAWGAEQMAKRSVLVRHLDAVETLGSTTFVCTDKTGTLTRNQMTVVKAWTADGMALSAEPGYDPGGEVVIEDVAHLAIIRLAVAAVRCSSGFVSRINGAWRPRGDPMEAAIDVFARRVGVDSDAERDGGDNDIRFPFDPRRRRMSIVRDGELVVKGAPDALFDLCRHADGARKALEAFTREGLRVLAVAGRAVDREVPVSAEIAERDLELYGLLALEDPPREDVRTAIAACRRAGIKVAMITGDHPETAAAIATETGLRGRDDPVLVGRDLPNDEEVLGAMLDRDGIVVARVSPEDKLRIARSLRARGHVVAMTGDGVNDGPALHEADVGIAMGESGTDVAREASDLVLLDDHFATIVAGLEQGRATFLNIRRFLTYHLSDNVAELTPFAVWALSGGRFPLALGVLQIIALDIGTDTMSAVALGAEPPSSNVLDHGPVSGRLLNRTVARRAFGLLGPLEALLAMSAFLVSLAAAGWAPGDSFPTGHALAAASGAAFMTVVFAQSANAFACRSTTRWPGALGWTSNRLLVPAVSIELVFAFVVLLVGPFASELEHAVPPLAGWLVALVSPIVLLGVDAVDKWRRRPSSGRDEEANRGPSPLPARVDRSDHRGVRPRPTVLVSPRPTD
jgi:magnesium-transporting ATPase (P-type)